MQRIVSSKDKRELHEQPANVFIVLCCILTLFSATKRVALYLFLVDTIGSTAPTTTTLLIPTSWVTDVTQNLFAINFF